MDNGGVVVLMFYLGCLGKKCKEDGLIDKEWFILNYIVDYLVKVLEIIVFFCDEIVGVKVE